jgi:hypothetical protein
MDQFIMGASAMASAAAGLFFLRFWRETRDRLFLIFALAFWLLGLSRLGLSWTGEVNETHTFLYVVRLLAFVLILVAIIDKNRSPGRDR